MAGRLQSGDFPSLNPRQLAALKQASPTPDQILAHMDDFNEEIVEQAQAVGVELAGEVPAADPRATPERTEPLPKMDYAIDMGVIYPTKETEVQDLDSLNAELEAKLEAQRAAQAQAAAEAAEQGPAPEQSPQQDIEAQVIQLLKDSKNAPSDQQIETWKAQNGEAGVQVISLGKGDVYVFTYLRRAAFQKIQAAIAKAGQIEGMNKDPEEMMMEQVLKQCILWPRPLSVEFFYNSRSGVIPTLYSAVMLHSYHLTPQQAMVLTAQL